MFNCGQKLTNGRVGSRRPSCSSSGADGFDLRFLGWKSSLAIGWLLCLVGWVHGDQPYETMLLPGRDTPAARPQRVEPERFADPRDLRVMSFNIRFGTANDGPNRWELRKAAVVKTIQQYAPDLLGTQETLAMQRDYIAEALPQYTAFGVGRDDGAEGGEMTAVFWKTERFEKLDGGHFWLSETPDVIASKSWDTSLTRMVTWVKLADRLHPEKAPVLWFNTHFDHRGALAREESAKLIRRRALADAANALVVITGDFNAAESSPPYVAMFDFEAAATIQLLDTYRHVHPQPSDREGTFSGFSAESTGGGRIDWIAVCNRWEIVEAEIDRSTFEGRVPSDHFPVTAVLRRAAEK